jgi:hypothetical protein
MSGEPAEAGLTAEQWAADAEWFSAIATDCCRHSGASSTAALVAGEWASACRSIAKRLREKGNG